MNQFGKKEPGGVEDGMKNAIVTVTDRAHSYAYDMEFPSDIGGDRLVPFLFQALREMDPALEYDAGTYGIYLQRAKHFVNSHQTFAQAGGRNGDILLVVDMNPGSTSSRAGDGQQKIL